MVSRKTKIILAILSLSGALFWMSSVSMADPVSAAHVSGSASQTDLGGTDSAGSFTYSETRKEGSKGKKESAETPASAAEKSEGSASKKAYSHKSHMYSHMKPEGSASKGDAHGSAGYSPHGKSYSSKEDSGHSSFHRSGKSPFEHVLCFKKKLGLTDEQVEKIKAHEFEFKKMKIQTDADHAVAHMELDRLAHAENVDEAGIRALADRISEVKSRKIHAMAEAKIAILNILTAEQRQKVSKMHSRD